MDGGIRLDTASYLFLKEPLAAHFINNSTQQGSAVYALFPENPDISTIQIVPNNVYSLGNLSNLTIAMHFSKTGFEGSLYAPSIFGPQTSPRLLFKSNDWDAGRSQCASTSLIDTIKGESVFAE
jgi:hypothetical protein